MRQLNQRLRHIYLLPGFDPGGTRTLLRLLRSELAQANPQLKLKSLGQRSHAVMRRDALPQEAPLAEISLLSWDDIVRHRWARHPWQLCWQGLGLYWHYLFRRRTLQTAKKLPKASFTFFWPLIFVLTLGLAALACTIVVAALPLAAWLRGSLIVILVVGWIGYGLKQAERRRVDWLFRAIHFSCKLTFAEGADLSDRLDHFADQTISSISKEPTKDHIVVGYSSGAYLALKLILRILQRRSKAFSLDGLQLITLGQNPAFLASISTRDQFRSELNTLLDASIPWTDFTCRDDWMSFAEVDVAGVLEREPSQSPRRCQVGLTEAAGLKGRKAVLNNQFVLHFQYFRHAPEFSCLDWILPSGADD